jgi:flagellar hook-associated protein 1
VSLSSSLGIALQALLSEQGAMSVTSNNIANINTPGYTREVANLEETPPFDFGNLQYGTGVELASIGSVRDSILQLRLDQETQTQGKLNTFTSGMNQIQTVFNEPAGEGLQSLLSNFFNSFQQLSTDPTNIGYRSAVIGAGQSLAAGFNQAALALVTQQQDANQAVIQNVEQINQLTSQVAQLNGQISTATGSGQNSNIFIDQRAQLINQLSQIVDIQQITADGNSLTLTTNGGTLLVAGDQSFNLQTQTNAATGFQDIYAQGTDITSSIQSGSLAGNLQLRDQEIPSLSTSLNTLADGIATAVNTQSTSGFDLKGTAGGNFFTPPASAATAALNLSVAITDPTKIAASGNGTPGDNTNATALANLQNQNIISGQNPISYYSGFVFQVGNDTSNATSQLSGENLLVQQLQDQVNAVSGVNLNLEGSNLIQYQTAYNAAAQVASVIGQLYQTAINMVATA